jgi:hypothetical protein
MALCKTLPQFWLSRARVIEIEINAHVSLIETKARSHGTTARKARIDFQQISRVMIHPELQVRWANRLVMLHDPVCVLGNHRM